MSVELLPPRIRPEPALRDAFAAASRRRGDVAAVYAVAAMYELDGGEHAMQDELHVELDEPPADEGAPGEVFVAFAEDLAVGTTGFTFTFTPSRRLPDVRQVGGVVWRRRG